MTPKLEVLFSPAEFEALTNRDLSATCCVVFDVLRATSSMVTALANGAEAIIPVEGIPEALRIRQSRPEVLLAGERQGVRIEADLTGSIRFDLGNSPREFVAKTVQGKTVVMTTTNGTRAFRACARAKMVLAGSLLNLSSTARSALKYAAAEVLVVCSGTFEEAAAEDALAAGGLCDLIWTAYGNGAVADSALMVRKLYLAARSNLQNALAETRNGKRLLSLPPLKDDVAFCAQMDRYELSAAMDRGGQIRIL